MITKTISAMEARKRFGEIMNRVALRGERYIVKRAGKSLVTISPITKETRPLNWKDPFENPFATFTEWGETADDIFDNLLKRRGKKR
ncbi:hypothetical protein HY417_03800 [Candidatus Kaiserbacteria bacterium]|nr:hypothetical protein [Candidatus Kaiserbacteria bacterium]